MSKYVLDIDKVKRRLRISEKEFLSGVKQDIEIVGRRAELEAKQNAPKDTGKLAQSIFYEKKRDGLGARVTANVNYAPYVEFGTGGMINIPSGFEDLAKKFFVNGKGRMKAQPYLIPAVRRAYEDLKRRTAKRVQRASR